MTTLTLSVNGRPVTVDVEPRTHLADFVRDHLLLTGTHTGCEHGVCGACTLLLDGEPARACITLAVGCEGAEVRTIEDLDDDPVTARLRHAFSAEHALQCGYCTPGMLVTARDIVRRLPDADDDRVRLELAGNLCRCTGYNGIVRAIRRVLNERPYVTRPAQDPVPTRRFGPVQPAAQAHQRAAPATAGLNQRLAFAQPAEKVWAALRDPALIAACIPGAQLTTATDDTIEGVMVVALGPVRARFGGSATLAYHDSSRSGTVQGSGADDAGGTRLTAGATFELLPDGDHACILVVSIEYALRGALAQLARPRVVDALAGEIAGTFAQTLAARLDGHDTPAPKPLSAAGLLVRMARSWLRRIIAR